jgi:hypothetical protein
MADQDALLSRNLVQSFLTLLDEQRRLAMMYLEAANRGASRVLLDDLDSLLSFMSRDVESVRQLLAQGAPGSAGGATASRLQQATVLAQLPLQSHQVDALHRRAAGQGSRRSRGLSHDEAAAARPGGGLALVGH